MVKQVVRRIGTWSVHTQLVIVAAGAAHVLTALAAWEDRALGAMLAHDVTGVALAAGVAWVAYREGARTSAARDAYRRWLTWCACAAPALLLVTFALGRAAATAPAPTTEEKAWLIAGAVFYLVGTLAVLTCKPTLTSLAYGGRRLVRGDTPSEAARTSHTNARHAQWRAGARRAGAFVWGACLVTALCVATLPDPWRRAAGSVMYWMLAFGIAAMLDVLSQSRPAREPAKGAAKRARPAPAPT